MANARSAWGIDIGNRALKAIKLTRAGDGLQIEDFELIEHEHVLSNAGDNRESMIQSALANFVQRHQIKGSAIAIGVSGQSSFARFIKLPPVEPKKIPEIVRFEAIQQIPFPLDDVEWSYQLFQDPESPDVEVGIFAMRKELIGQHIGYYSEVDLPVDVVQMNPLSVYNAMYYDQRLGGTTMIVDLGAENTDLIIAEGETIWLRSIPIGGNNFTEALVKSFKLNFAKAEDLKRNAATSKYARQIFQAMRPVFADLVAEIQRSIGFYASVHRDSRIKRIIALGGTFRLPGLQKYLQQNLQLEVDRVDTFASGVPNDAKLATALNENLLSMSAAYGLAIQAMGDAKITSSLLPEHIRRERLWQDKTKWFGAAAALFVLGTGVGVGSYYLTAMQGTQNTSAQAQIATVERSARANDSAWSEIEQAGAADRELIVNVKSMEEYRDLWPNLIRDIHAALPDPQPEVVSGDPDKIKQVPREQRNLVLIDSIKTQYLPDATSALATPGAISGMQQTSFAPEFDPTASPDMMPPGMGPGGRPMFGAGGPGFGQPAIPGGPGGPAGALRGFVISIRCTTPNAAGVHLVNNSLVRGLEALKKESPEAQAKRYYVGKVTLGSALKLADSPARRKAMEEAYKNRLQEQANQQSQRDAAAAAAGNLPGARQRGGMPNLPPGLAPNNNNNINPNQVNLEAAYADPVTGENVLGDTECEVQIVVVLDPPPPTVAAAEGQ